MLRHDQYQDSPIFKTAGSFIVFIFLMLVITVSTMSQPSIDGYHVYYGNLHNHSNVSDGEGTPDEAYNYAKNVAQLDFFGLSDHANLMNAAEWLLIKTTANLYNEDSVFAAFYGFEWTTYFSYGHVNVINTEDYCSNNSPTNTFNGLINWLNARNGAAFFNHPGWDPFAFSEFDHFTDPPCSKFIGMELWNDHDGFSKYYYNNGYYNNDGNKGYFDEALIRGWKIGAAGGDDNHTATWGTATPWRMGVLAPAKTRSEIFSAILEKRFFSTLDQNLVLSIKINGFDMGSTILGGDWNLTIQSFDADNEIITDIDLLKNGVVIQSWTPGITHPVISGNFSCADGDYFYARVTEADGDEAISSPVFISGLALPPLIAITYPPDGEVYTTGSDIPVMADASDDDGTVTLVEFFIDNELIGQDNIPPFTTTWMPEIAGTYYLTASATDDLGLETVSDSVMITIEPFQPLLSVTPLTVNVTSASGGAEFIVTSNTDWTVISNQEWCIVNSSGSGDGSIMADYSENTATEFRIAEIAVSVAGLPPVIVTITQEGMVSRILNLNVLLQGLYNGNGTMRPVLDETGNAHWGAAIADKITVELHESSNYQNTILSVQGVDLHTDGNALIMIPDNVSGSFYLVVKHRNSIETVSALPLIFSETPVDYNFNLNTKAYGNNLIFMPDGWWAVYGGDVVQDGIIDIQDMIPVDNDSGGFQSGYLNSDVNGDGITDAADMIIVDNNATQFVGAIHPP
ncbi:MAG: CehA/McbA family metallohydrolase [Lentimicrobium sp.]